MENVFEVLHGHSLRHADDIQAAAPSTDRVPQTSRGLSVALLRRIHRDLRALGRGHLDSGQVLNGAHTTDSQTDWQQFSRGADPFCIKACTLHTGVSFAETMIDAGLTKDENTEEE